MFDSYVEELLRNVEAREVGSAAQPVSLPVEDDQDDAIETEVDIGYAEGQFFMIEYLNAAGQRSRRRITVTALGTGKGGVPILTARCHERKAMRSFRIDRIQCCIGMDGEVFEDVAAFMADTFGMSVSLASRKAEGEQKLERIRQLCGDWAVLLKAMSVADLLLDKREARLATDHLAAEVERAGLMVNEGDIAWLQTYFGRLRPTERVVRRALERLSERPVREKERFFRAAVGVMDADERRDGREFRLLDAMARELTGAGAAL